MCIYETKIRLNRSSWSTRLYAFRFRCIRHSRWNASLARTYDISALNGSVRGDTACLTLVGGSLASKRLTSTIPTAAGGATCITPWILKCALGEIISRFKIEVGSSLYVCRTLDWAGVIYPRCRTVNHTRESRNTLSRRICFPSSFRVTFFFLRIISALRFSKATARSR